MVDRLVMGNGEECNVDPVLTHFLCRKERANQQKEEGAAGISLWR